MRLRFGNLQDLILMHREEVRMLQVELNALIIKECNNVEKCGMRLAGINCDDCFVNKQCREESLRAFAKIDLIEEGIKKKLLKLKYLSLELLISQNKGIHIKHIGLDLFP